MKRLIFYLLITHFLINSNTCLYNIYKYPNLMENYLVLNIIYSSLRKMRLKTRNLLKLEQFSYEHALLKIKLINHYYIQ